MKVGTASQSSEVELLHAADVTAAQRPNPTPHRSAFMSRVTSATTISLIGFGAAGDRSVSVNDQRAGTRRHGSEDTECGTV